MDLDTNEPNARGRGRLPSAAVLLAPLRTGLGKLNAGKRRLAAALAIPSEPSASSRGRSPSLAALLSFLWPGLGQFYVRNRRAAVLLGIPALLVLLILVYQMRKGPFVFAARFVDPTFSRDAAAIVILAGLLRLVAVGHAFFGGERRQSRRILDGGVVAVLAAIIVVSHAGAGYFLAVTSEAGGHAFGSPNPSLIDLSTPVRSPGGSATSGPTPTPVVTPAIDHRVTIVFTAVGQETPAQYDAIEVVSYDPTTHSVQMVDVPRDSASYPLYFGGYISRNIHMTWLPKTVSAGYLISPDSPYMTLVKEAGYLIGIPIDYYAAMDMTGFAKMIDKVGGVDVVNPRVIADPDYDWLDGSPYGFTLAAGTQHLDGRHAIAYVRSRGSEGDNNFVRDSRQQQVLVALLHKMAQPSQILNLLDLISTLGSSVSTNFPADKVADYVDAIGNDSSVVFKQVVLSPSAGFSDYIGGYVCLFNDKVAAESIALFGKDSLWYGKTAPETRCPS
jgi:LCP family protein required for cell wall assembly